jgi:hypothetical protein
VCASSDGLCVIPLYAREWLDDDESDVMPLMEWGWLACARARYTRVTTVHRQRSWTSLTRVTGFLLAVLENRDESEISAPALRDQLASLRSRITDMGMRRDVSCAVLGDSVG